MAVRKRGRALRTRGGGARFWIAGRIEQVVESHWIEAAQGRAADHERGMSLGATKFAIKPSSYPELVAFANDIAEIARG